MTENKTIRKGALYTRVSTTKQEAENQIKALKTFASQQNIKVVKIYIDEKTGRVTDRPQFQQMLKDARLRKFDVILIWNLDRFCREGMMNTQAYIERLERYDVGLKSLTETWLDTTDKAMAKLLIAIFSWVNEQEVIKISERTKAGFYRDKKGITRSVKHNKPVGRPKGRKDKHKRKNLGYLKRWEK